VGTWSKFTSLPGRILLDTCILNMLYEEGEYIFEGYFSQSSEDAGPSNDLRALREIFQINERAAFQLLVSPLTVAEVANIQDFSERERRLRWVLDVLDHWLIMLDEIEDRASHGGTVRHRFKLSPELQEFEGSLMELKDLRRDPFDRLLLLQYKMASCDAFLTVDEATIWRHREALTTKGITVLRPSEFWSLLEPWAALWL
jgi:hypothetical protein